MKPELWHPPLELSDSEKEIVSLIRRAKLFVFLRKIRHQLFDDEFQQELAEIFADHPKGQPPVSPAKLALVTILQAYTGASDDEAIESLLMDRRWQLVLDCLDCQKSPLGKGTLVRFRQAMIRRRLDRRLIERTVELAKQTKGFGTAKLRAALDSSPLWGAGKVEDTINLLGHALEKVLKACAVEQGREPTAIATEAGASIVNGSSVKAQLDVNWDREDERSLALSKVLEALEAVENWVAKNRRISVEDAQMRCQECPLQKRCTTSKRGRSVSIHPDEEFLTELRQRQLSFNRRAQLRQRVAVEHSLAHLNRWQGNQARYIGLRKNLFDLRRTAVVHNLHIWARFMDRDRSQSGRA